MRMVVNRNGVLLNLDSIRDLHVPGYVALKEPLVGTVVRLKEGIARVRLRTFVGVKLDKKEGKQEQVPRESTFTTTTSTKDMQKRKKKRFLLRSSKGFLYPFKKFRKASARNAHGLLAMAGSSKDDNETSGKDDIRRRIYKDIKTELVAMKELATKFETIPVRTHIQNLRLYRDSFKGSDAVDFLLGMGVAKTRKGAIEIARQMQADFSKQFWVAWMFLAKTVLSLTNLRCAPKIYSKMSQETICPFKMPMKSCKSLLVPCSLLLYPRSHSLLFSI
jgi:hypothetical protein